MGQPRRHRQASLRGDRTADAAPCPQAAPSARSQTVILVLPAAARWRAETLGILTLLTGIPGDKAEALIRAPWTPLPRVSPNLITQQIRPPTWLGHGLQCGLAGNRRILGAAVAAHNDAAGLATALIRRRHCEIRQVTVARTTAKACA